MPLGTVPSKRVCNMSMVGKDTHFMTELNRFGMFWRRGSPETLCTDNGECFDLWRPIVW
jgi:hypothetical protein